MDAMELPEDVKQQLEKFEAAVASVEAGLEPLLLANRRELEQALSPVERAKVHVTLANAVSTLFCMYLKTVGLDPAEHAVKRELERVELYRAKVERAGKPGRAGGAKLDVDAADRFISGNLSGEQKEALKQKKKAGGGGGGSAAEDAEAFLEGMAWGGQKRKSIGGKSSGGAKKGKKK